jgi:hypothetical protein
MMDEAEKHLRSASASKRIGEEAQQAFTRAASLTDDPALRDYLFKRAANSAQMTPAAR